MAVIFYARVSATEQTLEYQRQQAEAAGFKMDRVLADHEVTGSATTLGERPEGKRLFLILRGGDTLVVPWVDHLGRSYADVCDTIRQFMRQGIVIRTVTAGLIFDEATEDPQQEAVQHALIEFMAATAQINAAAVNETQSDDSAAARLADEAAKYRGPKPSFGMAQLAAARDMFDLASNIGQLARGTALRRQTVYGIRDDRGAAQGAPTRWDV